MEEIQCTFSQYHLQGSISELMKLCSYNVITITKVRYMPMNRKAITS